MLNAYANFSRWVCDCPVCNSAELVKQFGQTARWAAFRCSACGYAEPLAFPEEVEAIEVVLLLRPQAANRNWRPGETMQTLTIENVLHGVEEL